MLYDASQPLSVRDIFLANPAILWKIIENNLMPGVGSIALNIQIYFLELYHNTQHIEQYFRLEMSS